MSISLAQWQQQLPNLPEFDGELRRPRITWRRILIALVVVLLLHLVFFFGIAPYLGFQSETPPARTEIVQISPKQLEDIKKQIRRQQNLTPLLQQEVREEYKTKEAPKDAQMMGPINQSVPKQMVAGARNDQPEDGGGGAKARPRPLPRQQPMQAPKMPEKLNLSKLGLGSKIAPPPPRPQTLEDQIKERSQAEGQPGPPGLFRPRGFDADNIEKGDRNLLNAVESEYYSFFARFNEPLVRNWIFLMQSQMPQMRNELIKIRAKEGITYTATVEFALDRQGNFHYIKVLDSSGLPTMDKVCVEAFRKLGSLPNPPAGLFEGGQYFVYQASFGLVNNANIESGPQIYW